MDKVELPVPVLDTPHWRVNIRPETYHEELLPTLADCFRLIERTKVVLRGWEYPHISPFPAERATGSNWVASWSDFFGQLEYWRLYQSGQFVHLFTVREVTEQWYPKLRAMAQGHLGHRTDIDWTAVRGYISIINMVYTLTEIFEFAARLCQTGIYSGNLSVSIQLKQIKGFILTAEMDRVWLKYCASTEDELGHVWTVPSDQLVASSADISLKAAGWFFERFGWVGAPVEVFKKEQEMLLRRHG